MTSQETEPKLPASVEGPPVEALVGKSSLQGWAHWKVPLGVCHQPYHKAGRSQGSVTSGQTTTREGVKPHPPADDWIKGFAEQEPAHQSKTQFFPSLPSRSLHKSLSLSHERTDRSSSTVSQKL